MRPRLRSLPVLVLLSLALFSPNAAVHAQQQIELRYSLWEQPQLAPYQACADAFTAQNPNITIKIEQLGWADYWTNLTAQLASGSAPDVFTDHLAYYPTFANQGLLTDIQPLVQRDQVATDIYIAGLADLWTRNGQRYGLPKDWDTIAIVYNSNMFKAANIEESITQRWTWNGQDGGTFGQTIAQLTIDENGNNGLSPKFDKTKVKQYGFLPGGSGGFTGQQQWSHWAVSNGFAFTDGPWTTKYHNDDPRLAETLQWYADLHNAHGFTPGLAELTNLGDVALLLAGKGAMVTEGS
jgi:multiple sugar transport system substrate-binding protein